MKRVMLRPVHDAFDYVFDYEIEPYYPFGLKEMHRCRIPMLSYPFRTVAAADSDLNFVRMNSAKGC